MEPESAKHDVMNVWLHLPIAFRRERCSLASLFLAPVTPSWLLLVGCLLVTRLVGCWMAVVGCWLLVDVCGWLIVVGW